MGKYNEKASLDKQLKNSASATLNHEGGLAFEMSAKTKLVTVTLASFVEGKFYTTKGTAMQELQEAIRDVLDVDPVFVLKLAVYARRVMHLRSVPLFLLNEYANSGKSVEYSRKYVDACIERADEIPELLALSMHSRLTHPEKKFRGKKYSQFIIGGLRPAFNRFDAYQLSKYKKDDNEVSLKDALLICHPVPKDKAQQDLFDQVVAGTLAPPDTWEVAISANGSTKESWEKVIETWIKLEI